MLCENLKIKRPQLSFNCTFKIPSMNFLPFKIITYRGVIPKVFPKFTRLFWGNIFRQNRIRILRNLGGQNKVVWKIANVSKPRTKPSNNPRWTLLSTKELYFLLSLYWLSNSMIRSSKDLRVRTVAKTHMRSPMFTASFILVSCVKLP